MERTATGQPPTLAGYQLRLSSFEGPLDVLLRLIERSQLAIEDISLIAVTDQFLAYTASLGDADPAVIADFATVGARLTVLKSRSLLPRPVPDDEEPEPSDLVTQLRAYKRIRDLAAHLGALHAGGGVAHAAARPGAVIQPAVTQPARLVSHDASALVRALRRRLAVSPRLPVVIRQRRVLSIREVVERIAILVRRDGPVRFSRVVAPYVGRTDVATAFLAVLVLTRRNALVARQDDLFGEILLGPGERAGLDGSEPIDEFAGPGRDR